MGSGDTSNTISGDVRGCIIQARDVRQIVQVFDGGGSGEMVVPAQLPPVPRAFTGRRRELELLREWRRGTPAIMVVHGVGGVGKTVLALRFLHEIAPELADGSLFVDLRAFSGDAPVAVGDALEWFLLALGVRPDRVPGELAARTGLYRSMIAGRSVAVLLDNALSAAQVRPLLPGPAGVVVVTSRLRLDGLGLDGARFVEVGPLDMDTSVELITNIVADDRPAAEPRATRELARLCGGLPVALSVVGARLSARPGRPLEREANALREQGLGALSIEGQPAVRILFDLSYRELPAEAALLYRMCSVHPAGEFDAAAAAACAGLPLRRTEELLGLLIDANLVREVEAGTCVFHDLLLLHARSLLTDGELPAAQRRLVEWYLDVLVSAELVLHPFRRRTGPRYERPISLFRNDIESLAWLTAHRTTLRAVFALAVERRWDELVWQFSEAFWGFFLHTRHYRAAIEMFGEGVAAARRLADPLAEARLRSQLGFAHAKIGEYQEAIDQNTESLRLAETVGDQRTVATAYSQLGRAARGLGDFPAAIDYYSRARDVQQAVGEIRGVALCRRRIGEVLATLGRHDEAVAELRAAAGIFESMSDRTQHARTLMFLGLTALESTDPPAAADPLRQALDLMRALGSAYYQAEILCAIGDLAARAGEMPAARRAYTEAAELYEQVEDPKAASVRAKLSSVE